MNKYAQYLATSLLFTCSSALAEPWVDTSNIYLKSNIQMLADSGRITTPVTTYPLMWNDIDRDLKNMDTGSLSANQLDAFMHIKYQLKLAKENNIMLRASATNDGSRFTSFGEKNRYKHSVQAQASFMSDNFAVKLAPGYASKQDGTEEFIVDGSYVSGFIGNWVLTLGKQDRWWGSMWDTSYAMTNNAQPIPALSLSRKSAEPVSIPFTDLQVPWTVTTYMGVMDDERTVKDTLLWGFRLNFKPLPNLEIGVNRLAQWGGTSERFGNHPTQLCNFFDILIGKTNGETSGDSTCGDGSYTLANQQAGFDWRYSFSLANTPISFYGNYLGEDGDNNNTFGFVTKAQKQFGFDAYLNPFDIPTLAYIEYGDSLGDCGARDGIGDCFYDHSTYATGMRYKKRTLGNLYDNDAETLVIGAISQLENDLNITTKLRYLDLNYDNSDRAPDNPIIGNPVTAVHETMVMLSTSVEKSYKQWRVTVGGDLSHSSFENNIDDKKNINVFLDVEYIL